MSEADLKQEAEQRLGTEIESSEWDKTKSYAERKLNLSDVCTSLVLSVAICRVLLRRGDN